MTMAAKRGFLQDALCSAFFKIDLCVVIQGSTGVRVMQLQSCELSITSNVSMGENLKL